MISSGSGSGGSIGNSNSLGQPIPGHSGSGSGHSNQIPPSPSINPNNPKPMGTIRSLRFVEVEAPKLMHQGSSGDRPGVAELDTNVGVVASEGELNSMLDNSRFNIGVLDEARAAVNDKILQERLLEAKALGRSKASGATMHKFSLWGGGGGGAGIGSKSTGFAINVSNNATPNSKIPTPSHSHPPTAIASQPNSPAAASVVSGTSSVVTGTTYATNKSTSNSRLRGPLAGGATHALSYHENVDISTTLRLSPFSSCFF